MSTGKQNHIVPRMMIRRFAGDDGKLVELYKPTLAIGTRRRAPKGILFRDDEFYRDAQIDWDDELLKKIEDRFARYYPVLAVGNARTLEKNGKAGAALVDWIASMLCRTTWFLAVFNAAWKAQEGDIIAQPPLLRVALSLLPKVTFNIIRDIQFAEYQDLMSRPGWRWLLRSLEGEPKLVITDNPVCFARNADATRPIVLVPLTKTRILFGGSADDIEECFFWSVSGMNLYLASKADRSIFAADRATLESIVRELTDNGDAGNSEWMEAARKPHFGLPERIRTTPIPESVDTHEFCESMKAAYGESVLEPIRRGRSL